MRDRFTKELMAYFDSHEKEIIDAIRKLYQSKGASKLVFAIDKATTKILAVFVRPLYVPCTGNGRVFYTAMALHDSQDRSEYLAADDKYEFLHSVMAMVRDSMKTSIEDFYKED